MKLRSKHLEAACLLIFLVNVFCDNRQTCLPNEYQSVNGCCLRCPPGNRVKTDCTEFRSTSCLPCVKDTFMDIPTGRKMCYTCTTCVPDSGLKIYSPCTATMDSLCEPLEGFHCVDLRGNHCAAAQKHKRCQPGQYIKQKGTALTDTRCSDCSDGTFSDGTRTSCQPHTQCESQNLQLKQKGTSSTDTECGQYSSTDTECGHHSSTDTECGHYSSTSTAAAIIVPSVLIVFLFPLAYFFWRNILCRGKTEMHPIPQGEQRPLGKDADLA